MALRGFRILMVPGFGVVLDRSGVIVFSLFLEERFAIGSPLSGDGFPMEMKRRSARAADRPRQGAGPNSSARAGGLASGHKRDKVRLS